MLADVVFVVRRQLSSWAEKVQARGGGEALSTAPLVNTAGAERHPRPPLSEYVQPDNDNAAVERMHVSAVKPLLIQFAYNPELLSFSPSLRGYCSSGLPPRDTYIILCRELATAACG